MSKEIKNIIKDVVIDMWYDLNDEYISLEHNNEVSDVIIEGRIELKKNEKFKQFIRQLFDEAFELLERKNSDYSTEDDPLRNFRMSEVMDITSLERAVFVRLLDKISRIANGINNKGFSVKDEKFRDTVIDAINYLAILLYVVEVENDRRKD